MTDIDNRIGIYSDAFDFYMEEGDMPPTVPADDALGDYMKSVVDNNPQIDGSDPVWVDIFKEGVLGYLTRLLTAFSDIQSQTDRELAIIDEFEAASIEKKRAMWGPICKSIMAKYTRYEVDVKGFSDQFATGDRDAIFSALISDWRQACLQSCDKAKARVLEASKRRWEASMFEIGKTDYEERRKIADIALKSPVIKQIVEILGRENDSTEQEDNIVYTFLPHGAKNGLPSDDIDSIEQGDNLQRVVASEFAMPDDLFYKKYATKELQQLAQPRQRKPKKTEEHRPKPRPKKGPIIVGVDTSGSMHGKPEIMAKALVTELVKLARREKRNCYLLTFSVRVKQIDLGSSANILKMKEFLDTHFTGGTNPECLLRESIKLLDTEDYEMADVLIISDFYFPAPLPDHIRQVKEAKAKGTRFYGLKISSNSTVYNHILDRWWGA